MFDVVILLREFIAFQTVFDVVNLPGERFIFQTAHGDQIHEARHLSVIGYEGHDDRVDRHSFAIPVVVDDVFCSIRRPGITFEHPFTIDLFHPRIEIVHGTANHLGDGISEQIVRRTFDAHDNPVEPFDYPVDGRERIPSEEFVKCLTLHLFRFHDVNILAGDIDRYAVATIIRFDIRKAEFSEDKHPARLRTVSDQIDVCSLSFQRR